MDSAELQDAASVESFGQNLHGYLPPSHHWKRIIRRPGDPRARRGHLEVAGLQLPLRSREAAQPGSRGPTHPSPVCETLALGDAASVGSPRRQQTSLESPPLFSPLRLGGPQAYQNRRHPLSCPLPRTSCHGLPLSPNNLHRDVLLGVFRRLWLHGILARGRTLRSAHCESVLARRRTAPRPPSHVELRYRHRWRRRGCAGRRGRCRWWLAANDTSADHWARVQAHDL